MRLLGSTQQERERAAILAEAARRDTAEATAARTRLLDQARRARSERQR